MSNDPIDQLIAELERSLPPAFARSKVDRYLGGLFTAGYLATMDSEGTGVSSIPGGSLRCGRHVIYIKKPFLEWLRRRMTDPQEKRGIKIPPKAKSATTLLQSLHEHSK